MEVVTDTLVVVASSALGAALAGPPGAAAGAAISYPLVENSNNINLIDDLIDKKNPVAIHESLWNEFQKIIVVALILLFLYSKREKYIIRTGVSNNPPNNPIINACTR